MSWVGDKTSYWEELWTGYENLHFQLYEEIVLYRCKVYNGIDRVFRDFDDKITYNRLIGFRQATLWE